jgi:hypothetical protein
MLNGDSAGFADFASGVLLDALESPPPAKTKMPVERIAIFVIGCTALLIVLMLTLRYFF